ncbi:MAG: hypothetical protein H6739_02420 [Alphaproteobacteria bacterium]|nr:hypothetical protein [Alphaproteobacteria bacterium]
MRLRWMPFALAAALLIPGSAYAECGSSYTVDQLLSDTNTMMQAIRADDKAPLMNSGASLEAGLVCMGEPLPPQMLANVYRMLGVYYARGDEPQQAPLWFRTARELDPTFEWDIREVSQASSTYRLYEAAAPYEGSPTEPVPGKQLSVPANSKLLIDGRPLEDASATTERFHLIQQVGADNSVRASWLIEGNALPDRLLRDQTQSINEQREEADREKAERKEERRRGKDDEVLAGGYTSDEVTLIQRERPPAKTPLIVLGGATLLAAGGVYAASFPARQQFDAATNETDLYAAKTLTNTLVMASGGVLLLGVGVGTWGILLDGNPTVGVTFTW